jgi:multidrug efflux system membrane fusion protein
MAPDGDREIAIAIPEGEVAAFKPGQPAEVSFWSAGSAAKPLAGPPARGVAGGRSGDADVCGPDQPQGRRSAAAAGHDGHGAFHRHGGRRQDGVVPLAAVFQQGDQPAVWKVGADGADGDFAAHHGGGLDRCGAVVSEGLSGGEQIVAAGVNLLTAGEKVRIAAKAAGK